MYRERGLIQITGAANYTPCAAALDLDLVNRPELLRKAGLMTRLKMLIIPDGLLGLYGCMSAQMVSSPNSGSSYAPVDEGSRAGIVKYLNDGADFVRSQRREDAYKQMPKACGGSYRIDAEGSSAQGGVVVSSGTGSYWAQSSYWYIQFSCAHLRRM